MVDESQLAPGLRATILMSLRDDWASAAELMRRLDLAIASLPYCVDVLLVDDGSVQDFRSSDFPSHFQAIRSVRILRLRRNLGHQRAIALGLAHIERALPCDAVLVMDGDGEDTPEGALLLLGAFKGDAAVFARRSRRSELLTFRLLYQLYKLLHRVLTGVKVQVGNFSILPARYLRTLVATSELWNHYAAAVFRSGLPFTTIPIPRGRRIAGTSKMNLVALTAHGLSALTVFGDVVGVRILAASTVGAIIAGACILAVIAVRIFTGRAVPGWATYTIASLAIIIIQFITMAFTLTFAFLANRINLGFVPLRDYELFVDRSVDIYRHD
jgi:polyisoprenyl-phosphate glycosyltransferase